MTSTRKNIVQPASWWAAFSDQAKREKKTVSQWIGDCCRDRLPEKARSKLCDRPPNHRPKKAKN